MQIPVSGTVRLQWPRLAGGAAGAGGVLAAVGAARSLRVSAHNPSGSHALLLQPVLGGELRLPAMCVLTPDLATFHYNDLYFSESSNFFMLFKVATETVRRSFLSDRCPLTSITLYVINHSSITF